MLLGVALCADVAFARDVLTNNYDNFRSGANLKETAINNNNVTSATFGRLFNFDVDGPVLAQPLVVQGLALPNGETRDVVFLATLNNSLFAFDANVRELPPLWRRQLINFRGKGDFLPNGIYSTPVIDRARGVIFTVAALIDGTHHRYMLHAIRLSDGSDAQAPVLIEGNYKTDETSIDFDPTSTRIAVQRAALAIANNRLIIAFGGDYFEGWVFAYDLNDLNAKPAVFCTTCASRDAAISNIDFLDTKCIALGPGGGIWQSGRGPVVDEQGQVYFFTGNKQHVIKGGCVIPSASNACSACSKEGGCVCQATRFSEVCRGPDVCEANHSADKRVFDVNEALIQLDPTQGLKLSGWFRPKNWNIAGPEGLEINDLDLSGSGPLLIPGKQRIVGGGKQGMMYVLDVTSPAQPCESTLEKNCIAAESIQSFQVAPPPPRPNQYYRYIMGGPVLWTRPDDSRLYIWRQNDHLRSYAISDHIEGCNTENPAPTTTHNCPSIAQSEEFVDHQPGGILAISADGSNAKSAIVWAMTTRAINGPGKLMAFNALPDATGTLEKIWDSDVCVEDRLDLGSDFVPPTVANGKVFVATNANRVDVFGLIPNKKCTDEPLPKSLGPMMQ